MVRTAGFHPVNNGSIPLHPTNNNNTSQDGAVGSSLGSCPKGRRFDPYSCNR